MHWNQQEKLRRKLRKHTYPSETRSVCAFRERRIPPRSARCHLSHCWALSSLLNHSHVRNSWPRNFFSEIISTKSICYTSFNSDQYFRLDIFKPLLLRIVKKIGGGKIGHLQNDGKTKTFLEKIFQYGLGL